MNPAEQDRACIERIRAGDTGALEELFDRHADLLYSLARRIVGGAAEAEDVSQEAWLQIWRGANSYDPARGSVVAWMTTIARTRALDRIRREGSRRRVESSAEPLSVAAPDDPAADAAASQRSERMTSALGRLEPRHREVVELAYYRGLSQSEIAARLGAPLGTVKSWMRQALSRLTELVPREEDS